MASKNYSQKIIRVSILECFFCLVSSCLGHTLQKNLESHDYFCCHHTLKLIFLLLCVVLNMSTNNSAVTTSFEKLTKTFNRKELLQKLGLSIRCPRVADLKGL